MLMGLVQKQDIDAYWSIDDAIATPIFNKTMARNRFTQILSFLHLNNNEHHVNRGEEGHDPLFKVRTILDKVYIGYFILYVKYGS